MPRGAWGSPKASRKHREGGVGMGTRAFPVLPGGRDRCGRVNSFRMGQYKAGRLSGGGRSLVTWYLALGWQGQVHSSPEWES